MRTNEIAPRLVSGGSPRVKLAGTVIGKQERTTSKGTRMAFVQLSDAGGMCEVTVFAEVLGQARDLIASGKPLLVTANARLEEESLRLVADAITALDDAVAGAAAGLRVTVSDAGCIAELKRIVAAERRGRGARRRRCA